ncbi:unnamed protein product, partial [Candidula unifasciata]
MTRRCPSAKGTKGCKMSGTRFCPGYSKGRQCIGSTESSVPFVTIAQTCVFTEEFEKHTPNNLNESCISFITNQLTISV